MTERFSKLETQPPYQAITHVYAFPKGTFDNLSCEPSKELMDRWEQERGEEKRILRKHWFERLMGVSKIEILARYSR